MISGSVFAFFNWPNPGRFQLEGVAGLSLPTHKLRREDSFVYSARKGILHVIFWLCSVSVVLTL